MDDSQLITRIKDGDRDAFNELYGLYWALLVNYAGLFLKDETAEDIVHDVFIKIWTGRANLRDSGSLRSYLLRSVYNTSLNRIRSDKYVASYRTWAARQIEEETYSYYDPDNSDIIEKLYAKEVAGEIETAIESLPPKCRQVFRMSHIEGLSNREISETLNLSLSTVENHIYNALKQLRVKLSHYKMLILLVFYIMNR